MNTPEQIKPHASDYKADAWKQYTIEELEWWVRLLTKRASHRTDEKKRDKDLYDAGNYQAMLDEAVRHVFNEGDTVVFEDEERKVTKVYPDVLALSGVSSYVAKKSVRVV